MNGIDELAFNADGLVPVVAQDAETGEVLMLAYANREALERTRATGRAHYWSRSRGELWAKGATSGHTQQVLEVRVDCDADAVLYRVRQSGVACHTGERSCFYRRLDGGAMEPVPAREPAAQEHVLARLEEIVRQREAERPAGSYTTYLFEAGLDKILKKLGEETTEVVVAAKNLPRVPDGEQTDGDPTAESALGSEVADLLFHLLVLLRERRVPLARVWDELEARFGQPARRGGAPPAERPPA